MIYYDGRKWQPCLYTATFEDRGKVVTKHVKEKKYLQNMVSKHDHLTNLSFEPLQFTDAQNQRLEEVVAANVPEGFSSIAKKYVETGEFPEGYDHPLGTLKMKKEQEKQDKDIADAFFEIMKVVY